MSQKIQFKNHKGKWSRMAVLWNEFTKPGRPSKGDVKNFRKLIATILKGKKSPKIVVLGSTPEIRNCLLEFSEKMNAEIVCVDMTKDMYISMNHFIKRENGKEKFIVANWIELSKKIKPESVDVVIGDYVIGNVGGSEDKFLNEIRKALRPGGSFVIRAHVVDDEKNKFDLYSELKRTSRQVSKKEISIKEASAYFSNNLLFYTWHMNKENKLSLSYVSDQEYENLENAVRLKKNLTENKVLEQVHRSWFQMKDKYWTGYRRAVLENFFKRYFLINNVVYSNDYELAKVSPIYRLIKK